MELPYQCFGVFDGPAGAGASLATVNQLQDVIHENIHEIQEVVLTDEKDFSKHSLLREAVAPSINFDAMITGVLEQAFLEMVIVFIIL